MLFLSRERSKITRFCVQKFSHILGLCKVSRLFHVCVCQAPTFFLWFLFSVITWGSNERYCWDQFTTLVPVDGFGNCFLSYFWHFWHFKSSVVTLVIQVISYSLRSKEKIPHTGDKIVSRRVRIVKQKPIKPTATATATAIGPRYYLGVLGQTRDCIKTRVLDRAG